MNVAVTLVKIAAIVLTEQAVMYVTAMTLDFGELSVKLVLSALKM